jgi:hypothetical protein
MTTNVPPQYTKAEIKYRNATDPHEKVEALKEMIFHVPKHKASERLQMDLKKRLAKVQNEAQKKPKMARVSVLDHIDKEGAGQVVLVGLANSGKSSLLATVTNAEPEIAEYPYSTFKSTVGMMPFEDIQVQLIDLPPLSEFAEPWIYALVRNSDRALLLVDLSAPDPQEQLKEILDSLQAANIFATDASNFDQNYEGPGVLKKVKILAMKSDEDGAAEGLQSLRDSYGDKFSIVEVSILDEDQLEVMKRELFDLLELLRVYSKKPGEAVSKEAPYVMPVGSTMIEVAKQIHQELAETLDYAKIWGSAEFEGQRVERDHVMADGDIIEVHS